MDDIDKTFKFLKRTPFTEVYEGVYSIVGEDFSFPNWIKVRDYLNDNGWTTVSFNFELSSREFNGNRRR